MKVTLEGIKAKIKGETYLVLPDGRSTLCILTMENGYTIKGLSACVDPAEFNLDLGRKYAFEDALNQIWPLEGYLLAQRMFEEPPMTLTDVLEEATKQLDAEIDKVQALWAVRPERVKAMKDSGVWNVKAKRDKMIAAYAKHDAPWGLKKDGTPKSKPGKKTTK